MIQTLVSIWRVLDRRQRRRLVLLQVLSVIMGFCTLGAIAAVRPFFTVLQRQDFFVARFARSCRLISAAMADTFAVAQSPRYILESLVVADLVGIALFLSGRRSVRAHFDAEQSFAAVGRKLSAAYQHSLERRTAKVALGM